MKPESSPQDLRKWMDELRRYAIEIMGLNTSEAITVSFMMGFTMLGENTENHVQMMIGLSVVMEVGRQQTIASFNKAHKETKS
jgi:hypothetical protein